MRIANLVLAVLGSLYVVSAAAQGWNEFIDREELFIVHLPHPPAVDDITYVSEYQAALPGKIYTISNEQVNYSITVVNYGETPIEGDRTVWDFAGAVDYAAWNIRKRGGEITYDGWAQSDRIPGHQLQILNSDGSRILVAIRSHGTRLYILEARAAPGAPLPNNFQQSLRILDENGEVVRYDTDFTTRIEAER